MTVRISDNYKSITREEALERYLDLSTAWQDPTIPLRQWLGVAQGEIEAFKAGKRYKHFEALLNVLKRTPVFDRVPTLLDVGAASGFYREILKFGGFNCKYTGLDYSLEFARLALELFPDIDFKVGDARNLPFPDKSFDVVVSGCCLIHIVDYEKAIHEAARVAKNYVVLNRTPVLMEGPTKFFEKDAYGVRCIEIHFAQDELEHIFENCRMVVMDREDVFMDNVNKYGHTTILLKKKF